MKGWTLKDIEALSNRGMVAVKKPVKIIQGPKEREVARKELIKAGILREKTDYQTITGNVPSKSNCYKIIETNGHGSLAKTEGLKKYEESFMWQCGKYRDMRISTPFEIYINVFYPSKRSDLDNSLKIVLDTLQRIGAITNDNNCCKITAQKFIDKENPRIEFKIEKV